MKKSTREQGSFPIIAIIVILIAFGGISAVVYYVMNNESPLSSEVEEVRTENAQQAQASGYPDLWTEAGLPEYPSGTLTKKREGRDLSDGVQVTLETSDSISTVKSFWGTEMSSRGFTEESSLPGTEYATLVIYKNGTKSLTLQITKIDEGPNNKAYLQYHE